MSESAKMPNWTPKEIGGHCPSLFLLSRFPPDSYFGSPIITHLYKNVNVGYLLEKCSYILLLRKRIKESSYFKHVTFLVTTFISNHEPGFQTNTQFLHWNFLSDSMFYRAHDSNHENGGRNFRWISTNQYK